MLGNVQQKISCVYDTRVVEEPSSKRSYQPFKVVACETVKEAALSSDIHKAVATEKVDGTCVFVDNYDSKPWLWARLDRKPNKNADRKFKKYQTMCKKWEMNKNNSNEKPLPFEWNTLTDFKDVPYDWIPASGVPLKDGEPQPDSNGHIPGWVPVDPTSKQHLWHLSAVDLNAGLCLTLKYSEDEELEVYLAPLETFLGTTLELIGTHVNGNPYKIGSKQHPVHVLVRHGSIPLRIQPSISFNELKHWIEDSFDGSVEGVVWHCSDGSLFKVHRHHFGLKWPIDTPRLSSLPVNINIDSSKYENITQHAIIKISLLHGIKFDSLTKICFDLN